MKFSLVDVPAFLAVGVGAGFQFGWSYGLIAVGVVWLLAPYYAIASVDAGKGRIR